MTRPSPAIDQDAMLMEPWFQPRELADIIRRHQSVFERHKWSVVYEQHGCLRCKAKRAQYGANGFCQNCKSWITNILTTTMREMK
jgi:hypothetical protein